MLQRPRRAAKARVLAHTFEMPSLASMIAHVRGLGLGGIHNMHGEALSLLILVPGLRLGSFTAYTVLVSISTWSTGSMHVNRVPGTKNDFVREDTYWTTACQQIQAIGMTLAHCSWRRRCTGTIQNFCWTLSFAHERPANRSSDASLHPFTLGLYWARRIDGPTTLGLRCEVRP